MLVVSLFFAGGILRFLEMVELLPEKSNFHSRFVVSVKLKYFIVGGYW